MQERAQGRLGPPQSRSNAAAAQAIDTQLTIEGKLEKKKKTLLGAPAGKIVAILVDDVNMPLVEEYGAQPPVELLRQFQDGSVFFFLTEVRFCFGSSTS